MTARSRARDNNELIELINQAFDKVGDLATRSSMTNTCRVRATLRFLQCFAKYQTPGSRVLADIKTDPGNPPARIPGTELAHLPREVGDHGGSSHFIARGTGPGSTLIR